MTYGILLLIIIIVLIVAGGFYYLHSEKGKAQFSALEANMKAHVTGAVQSELASVKQHVSDELKKLADKVKPQ